MYIKKNLAWAAPGGQRAKSALQVVKALHDGKRVPNYPHGRPKPEAQQLEYLRYQIEMRVLGLGWSEYATRWSSAADSRIGTVAHLTKLLEELIKEDTARKHFPRDSVSGLPTEAAPPQLAAGGSTQLAAKAEGRRSLALSTPTRWRCGLRRDSTRTS